MNKYKLQFNTHLGSSGPSAILLESHCQYAVQVHMHLDCALSAVHILLPSVLDSFALYLHLYFPSSTLML